MKKFSLSYLSAVQENRRRESVTRFLAGTPQPKGNPKLGTATSAIRAGRELERITERWIHAAVEQFADAMVFGTSVTHVDAKGRRRRVNPRYLVQWADGTVHVRYPWRPFGPWRWKTRFEPTYGVSPLDRTVDDITDHRFKGLQSMREGGK